MSIQTNQEEVTTAFTFSNLSKISTYKITVAKSSGAGVVGKRTNAIPYAISGNVISVVGFNTNNGSNQGTIVINVSITAYEF